MKKKKLYAILTILVLVIFFSMALECMGFSDNPNEKKRVKTEEVAPAEEATFTYTGSVDGVAVILIVDFKTAEVSGSLSLSGDDYLNATIMDGKLNILTFEITTKFSGIIGSKESDKDLPFNGTITGKITDDLSTVNGEILNDEGKGVEFTATK